MQRTIRMSQISNTWRGVTIFKKQNRVNKNGRHSVMLIIALRIFLFAVGWPRGTRCPINAGYTCRLLNRRPRALYTYVYTRQWAYTPVRHATHQNWAQHGQPRHRQANARVLNLTEARKRQILTSIQRSQSAFSLQLTPICQTTTNTAAFVGSIWVHSCYQL